VTHKERARLFYPVNDEGQPIRPQHSENCPCTCLPSEPAPKPTKEQWLGMLAAAFAQVEAEAKPFCTCGAASCGSRLHSSWCDAA